MSGSSGDRSDSRALLIAIIGAVSTVGASLIGLLPTLLNRPTADPAAAKPSVTVSSPATPAVVPLQKKPITLSPPPAKEADPPSRFRFDLASNNVKYARFGRPPLNLGHRASANKNDTSTLTITNRGDFETLRNLVIYVRSPSEQVDRAYRLTAVISPRETLAVGKETRGWKLGTGDRVLVTADGYALPVEFTIPGR